MAMTSILAFWLVALVLIAVPGADWAFTISSALRARTVLPAIGGLIVGYSAMTAVVAAGIGALVAEAPAAMSVLTFAGGGYLAWQGVVTVASSAGPGPATSLSATPAHRAVLVQGIGVSALNPKALLLFLALLPQFTDPHQPWPVGLQIAMLGATFTATCAVFYLLLGCFASTILSAHPIAARAVSRLAGGGMILIGAGLIAENLLTG